MKLIDATNHRIGRLASYVAQDALNGETIRIVNSEKAVVTGRKKDILKHYFKKRSVGSRYQGPFYPKRPDRILKRTIRGMLPYKRERGRKAYKRVRAYIGVPEAFQDKEFISIKEAALGRIEKRSYMKLGALSKELGSNHA